MLPENWRTLFRYREKNFAGFFDPNDSAWVTPEEFEGPQNMSMSAGEMRRYCETGELSIEVAEAIARQKWKPSSHPNRVARDKAVAMAFAQRDQAQADLDARWEALADVEKCLSFMNLWFAHLHFGTKDAIHKGSAMACSYPFCI